MASIFAGLKERFGIVSPSPIDPALKAQLESRGMKTKIADLLRPPQPTSLFSDLKKKFGIGGTVLQAPLLPGIKQAVLKEPTVPVEERRPGEIVGAIARAPARAITSVAIEPAAGAVSIATGKEVKPEFRPRSGIERFLLGEEPIKGIFTESEEAQKFTKNLEEKLGFDPAFAQGSAFVFAPLFVAGMKGLDLTPLGGGDKKAGEQIVKNLIERYGDEVASLIVKKGDPAFARQALEEGGEAVVKNFVKNEAVSSAARFPSGEFLTATNKAGGTQKIQFIKEVPGGIMAKEPTSGLPMLFKKDAFTFSSEKAAPAVGGPADQLSAIKTKPELFQFSRRFEPQAAEGFVPEKVAGIEKAFKKEELSPVEVGVFDKDVSYTLPSGRTVDLKAGEPYVISGHNRLELMKRNRAALGEDIGAFIKTKTYSGTKEGIESAIRDSIMTNVRNKSMKEIEILDNAINGFLNEGDVARALDFNTSKVKFFQNIIRTFRENDLAGFWNASVAPKLQQFKNLDFAALQERLNFVERISKKTAAAVQSLSPDQAVAVKNQVADKLTEFLDISKVATLRGVEKNIDNVLDTIQSGGFKNRPLENLFGETQVQTLLQKRTGAQVVEKSIDDLLTSPLLTGAQKKRLGDIKKLLVQKDPALLKYLNENAGLTKNAEKTRELVRKITSPDFDLGKELGQPAFNGIEARAAKAAAGKDSLGILRPSQVISAHAYGELSAQAELSISHLSTRPTLSTVLSAKSLKIDPSSLKNSSIFNEVVGAIQSDPTPLIDLYHTAPKRSRELGGIINGLPQRPVKAIIGIKTPESVVNKIIRKRDEGKRPNYWFNDINDFVRGTAIYDSEKEIPGAFNAIKDKIAKKADGSARFDNYFESPNEWGYRGINADLQLSDGSIAELQIHTKMSKEISEAITPTYQGSRGKGPKEIEAAKKESREIAERIVQKYAQKATGAKERGFVTSVKEAIPELRARVAGQYIPRSTDDLAMKARNLIKDDVNAAEQLARTGTDDNAVAVSAELVKHYSDEAAKAADQATKNALYAKAAEIANLSARNLTELGQSVQAASILGRLTPEGQLRFAAREIQKYNETAAKKVPELTGVQAQGLLLEAREVIAMPDGIEKAMAFKELQNKIANLVPSSLYKKNIAIWKAGLLTGLKTTGLNTFSNLFHGITEIIKDVPAVAVDSVASLFTGKRTVGLTVRGTLGGIKEGFEKGWRYLRTGLDERDIAAKLDYKRVRFDSPFGKKVLQPYEETVFRALGAEDQPFYYGAKARSLQSQAIAQAKNAGLKGPEAKKFIDDLVQNPTDEMLKYAVNDAEIAVFQNKTALGKIAQQIQKAPGGEIVVPFGRTPAAVVTQIINYSPVGIVKTIVQNIGTGRFDQRLFAQGLGRGITGTAIIVIGAELFKKGLLALNRPKTEREQKQWELEGKIPNSIKIGDKYRSVNVLGPAGTALIVGGNYANALNESGSHFAALSTALAGIGKSLTEQTFLQGVQQVVEALNDPSRFAQGYAAGLLGSIIPTIVSDVARATDTFERRTEGVLGRLKSRIPGVRQKLEPQIDVFGRKRETASFLETMIDPSRPSAVKNDPLTQELRRLMDSGHKATPTQLGARYGYKTLTSQQNTALWIRAGELAHDKLSSLIQTQWYKKADDEQRAKQIGDITSTAGMYARAEAVLQLTEGLRGEELKKELSRLKADSVLTKTVYEKWLEIR